MKNVGAATPCYFLDATALAKLFVREAGSDRVRSLHDPSSSAVLATTRLVLVEVVASLYRRVAAGDIDRAAAEKIAGTALGLVESRYLLQEISAPVTALAAKLVAAHGLGAASAVQLAAARELKRLRSDLRLILVSSDPALEGAARTEGIAHEDPARPNASGA